MSRKKFAEFIDPKGLTEDMVYTYEKKGVKPSFYHIALIARQYRISEEDLENTDLSEKLGLEVTTKAPIVPDVDAFVVTQLTKQTAILAVLLELAAEQEARFSKQPVTKILNDLDKAVSEKEELMREASTVKHGSS